MRRAGRASVVVGAAVAAATSLAVSTRTWVDATIPAGVPGTGVVEVPGTSAAPVAGALALVALAAAGALTIAGRRTRVVVLALMATAGLGVALAAARVLTEPLGAARASLGAATGLAPGSVQDTGAVVAATAWPVVSAALGVVVVAAAVLGFTVRRTWDRASRFEQTGPSGATGHRVAEDRVTEHGASDHEVTGEVDARDGWDALSRGDDPTRG